MYEVMILSVLVLACGQVVTLVIVLLLARHLMKTLVDLQAAVAAEKTVMESAAKLLAGLSDMIRNLPTDQAAIDQLANDVQAQSDALAAAVVANTPPTV